MNRLSPAPTTFTVGYHDIHPDVSVNYQLNRFSDGSAQMVAEMRGVAARINDYRDYVRELTALSQQAFAQNRPLHAALYLRSAEFFMFPGDPAKQPARKRFISTMREVYGIGEDDAERVPYERGSLPAYRFTPAGQQGTIVMFGGFDSYIEELFAMAHYLVERRYDVVLFDGPGQGAALEDAGIPMTPDWERPVAAVLDHFALSDVTLFGISLGGCLALRAAAHEHRVARVVCDDILTDFETVVMRQLSATVRIALRALIAARAAGAVNALIGAKQKRSLAVEWGVRQGMHVTGTSTPYDFLRETARYETASTSALVIADVLLFAGSRDHYVPVEQLATQITLLSAARTVTARLFTEAEQAQNHVQIGNVGLSLDIVTDWLGQLARATPGPVRNGGKQFLRATCRARNARS